MLFCEVYVEGKGCQAGKYIYVVFTWSKLVYMDDFRLPAGRVKCFNVPYFKNQLDPLKL